MADFPPIIDYDGPMTREIGSETHDAATFQVAALYHFSPVDDPQAWRDVLEDVARSSSVRGTLLIAREGINGTIAGPDAGISTVLSAIRSRPGFASLDVKYSRAATAPFNRLKVRVKAEIVTLGRADVDPVRDVGDYVEPEDWNALISDPATLVIDTRNAYEGEIGAFAHAIQPNTEGFRDFPAWFETQGRALIAERKPARIAMYCTGGIRCEKATALLKIEGVEDVRHLHGGILRYLETVPKDQSLWEGECFVFDDRVSVGHGLETGSHTLCRACRMPVSEAGRKSVLYVEGIACERCATERNDERRQAYAERQRQIELAQHRGIAHLGQDAADRIRQAHHKHSSAMSQSSPDSSNGL